MLSLSISASRASLRAFSTTSSRASDVAKLTLVGRLGKDPEVRMTRNEKEYVHYTVATSNYPPLNLDGSRGEPRTTWHSVLSFTPGSINYLRNLKKGSLVFVEAGFEVREPEPNADENSPQGHRQIFLRHESLRVLKLPPRREEDGGEGEM